MFCHQRLRRIEDKLDELKRLVRFIIKQGDEIMSKESELLEAIQAETDAGVAAIMLLDKVVSDLADIKAGMDPQSAEKLEEALTKVKANTAAWAAAVVRNTPAEDPSGDGDHVPGM
jgi:uncharacterized protein YoxC